MTTGTFYIGQPIPEYNKGRIKVGFADDVEQRQEAHKCASPNFFMLKTYPCTRSWEKVLIRRLKSKHEFIGDEVFEVEPEQVREVVTFIDNWFAAIPALSEAQQAATYQRRTKRTRNGRRRNPA